jgi:hypothetical protein
VCESRWEGRERRELVAIFAQVARACTICSPHYYRYQVKAKKDLSDIWKEEDPNYKFNSTQEKSMKRREEKGWSLGNFLMPCVETEWYPDEPHHPARFTNLAL